MHRNIPRNSNESATFSGMMKYLQNSSTIGLVDPLKPWTLISILSLIIFLTALCFNAFALFLFFRNANLRTPFTTYIINLLIANLLNQLYQEPLEIVSYLYSFPYLGRPFCTAFLYGSYAIHSIVYSAHFLITLNRIWAVTSPVSYRLHNKKLLAMVTCVAFWVYVHIIILPGFIMDSLYFRLPLEKGCFIVKEPQQTWFIVEQMLLYDIPLGFLILAYPVICLSQLRRRVRRNRLIRLSMSRDLGNQLRTAREVITMHPVYGHTRLLGLRARRSNAFLVLTLLTLSNCLFLMPLTVAYNLSTSMFVRYELEREAATHSAPELLYTVATMLFYAQAVADPILFTLALDDVRCAALSTLRSVCSSMFPFVD